MFQPRFADVLALAVTALVFTSVASAGECRCAHCGGHAPCQKVCRLVCEEKKVEIVCWGAQREDFCVPGPSERGCKHCEEVCDSCADNPDPQAPYSKAKKFVWYDWRPGCATIHTRTKLMKKTVTKKIPSYKWVVEDLCADCDSRCVGASIAAGVEVPPPPLRSAKLKYAEIDAPVPADR